LPHTDRRYLTALYSLSCRPIPLSPSYLNERCEQPPLCQHFFSSLLLIPQQSTIMASRPSNIGIKAIELYFPSQV
jgi:hypothetical protein